MSDDRNARTGAGGGPGHVPETPDHPGSVEAALRALPRVDRILDAAAPLVTRHGRDPVRAAIRAVIDRHRARLTGAAADPATSGLRAPDEAALLDEVATRLATRAPRPPQRVINATGVVVHTNLGRAPLSQAAVAAMQEAAGYCDLEYDLDTGRRGSRGAHVDGLLAEVTGGADAMVVNNAAAALVLAVAALAGGRQVVVSRGELIEIGGSFRLPDIIASAGATLVEVGTTNRTRADDYRAGDDAAVLLRMHPSNYRITGFTEAPSVPELRRVADERGIPLMYDVGSGLVDEPARPGGSRRTGGADGSDGAVGVRGSGGRGAPPAWAAGEPTLRGAITEGCDLVIASGDKLLGGPQAGLLVGRPEVVARCRRHPLARALRVDKTRIAALVATLSAHRAGRAPAELPVWRMLTAGDDTLQRRSHDLADRLRRQTGLGVAVVPGRSVPGGGSAPGTGIDGPTLAVDVDDAEAAARHLRGCSPPVVVRVEDGRLVIDLRTVEPADDDEVGSALCRL